MKRHIFIFAFLLSAIQVLAANVFVFSSHETSITDQTESPTVFDVYSEDTQGYSDGSYVPGFAMLPYISGYPLIAGTSEDKRFIGWYSKKGGWDPSSESATVASADLRITEETELTKADIEEHAGQYGDSLRLVVAKYVSLYKIEAEVVPAGAGTVSGTNTYEEGKSVSLRASANSGYAFKEWSTNDVVLSSSPELNFTAKKGCAGTYMASFTGKVYTVTFNQQGGAGGADPIQAQYMEQMPGPVAVPERYGYTFGGYYSDQDGKGTQYYTSDGESAHVWDKAMSATLYAEWIPQMGDLTLEFSTGVEKICYRLGESAVWTTNTADTTVQVQVGTKVHAYGIPAAGYEITDYYKEHQWEEEVLPDGILFKPTAREMTPVYTVTFVDPTGAHDPVRQSVEREASAKAPTDWTRRGYALSWDKDFSSVIADMTVTAVWTPNPYVIAFDGNGGAGEMEDLAAVYDKEIALTPNAFTKGILTFLHWTATVDGEERTFTDGEVVSNLTDVAMGTNRLSAVWGEDYLVEFNANGATSGTMEQQRFVRNVSQPLSSNAYLRTGHTFLGWAVNRERAVQEKVAYTNMEEVVNLAPVGTTNVLYATWKTNRFTVVFNANGGSGTMNDQTVSYGHGQTLDKCTFTRPAPWEFSGWLDEATGLTYDDEAPADTLRTEDGATVVLKAQWTAEVGELSEAMGCTNLRWIDGNYKGGQKGWAVCSDKGYESDSCALHEKGDFNDATMHAQISSLGKLSFRWQPTFGEKLKVSVKVYQGDKVYTKLEQVFMGDDASWENLVELTVSRDLEIDFNDIVTIEVFNFQPSDGYDDKCETYVDAMTWAPEGGEPTPGEPVTVTTAGVEGNVFSLTIPTISGVEYGVWTNADLTIDSWGLMGEPKPGDGNPWKVEWTILPGFPQLFFRAHKVEYK